MGKLNIIVGDITDDKILNNHDLIVNPTNPPMLAGAGVSGAIFKKAGVDILENYTQKKFNINYFTDHYNKDNVMKIGDIRITPGFNLNMDIMFVQGLKEWEYDNSLELLIKTYENMLKEIEKNKYKNILLPSIGTGDYGFEHKEIGKIITKILKDYIKDKNINIDLVIYDKKDIIYY